MAAGLALFVKTPGHSPVKSRLWPTIGREAAEALYLDCAAAVAETVVEVQRRGHLHAYWAVAEAQAKADPRSPWQGLPRLAQGEGDLGERMATVYEALLQRHGTALLIGTDVPQVTAELLIEAVAMLAAGGGEWVIGPSDDGGFWLIGGNHALPRQAWTTPRYSTPHAREDFLAGLPTAVRRHLLPSLCDLDEGKDLAVVAAALAALPQRRPAQTRVLQRLDTLLATQPR